ncbi:MAG: antibiotic biosynthesis monooxygenase family protein [Planctomycetales bacterium]
MSIEVPPGLLPASSGALTDGYYAVIFTSRRTDEDAAGYSAMAERMLELAAQQPGYLGVESARDESGLGITVSYWQTTQAIRAWREQVEHRLAQGLGRSQWYANYRLRVCRVERDVEFKTEPS